MFYDLKEFIVEFLLPFSVFFTLIFGVIGIGVYVGERSQCAAYEEITGVETKYNTFMCYINDPEYGWMSYAERKATRFAERTNK